MPLHPTWQDLTLRLLAAMIAGVLIGLDRGTQGHAAGLRTTMLVGLAAALAMMQANVLLPVAGKATDSFAVLDLMRFPLGILTGVGFIGGGAILKRGNLVTGLTTASTLWVITVIGLCFGGGQLALGSAGTVLALLTLWALKLLERRIPRERIARVVVYGGDGAPTITAVMSLAASLGCRAVFDGQYGDPSASGSSLAFHVTWQRDDVSGPPLRLLQALNEHFRVEKFEIRAPAG